MRILIGDFTLVPGRRDSPEDIQMDFDDEIQIQQFVRAAHAEVVNRGNSVARLAFGVTRTHPSFEEAELFCLRHKAEIPQSGLIEISAENQLGTVVGSVWLTRGTLHSAKLVRLIGVTTVWRYTLTAGELLTVKPI